MWRGMQQWLRAFSLSNPIERAQAPVFQLVLITLILLGAVLCIPSGVALLFGQTSSPATFIAALILLLAPSAALVLLRRGDFERAVFVASLGFVGAHSLSLLATGLANNGAQLLFFVLPLTLSGMLARLRGLLITAGASVIVVVGISMLEEAGSPFVGFAPPPPALQSVSAAISFGIMVVVVTILFGQFGQTLRQTLHAALTREQELDQLRKSLEVTVAHRTSDLQMALADVEAQVARQAQLLGENEQQRDVIRSLSVPVLPLSSTTLVMPLIGVIDSQRLHYLQEQALRELEQRGARYLLIDITGTPAVDHEVAHGLVAVLNSARLLGASVMLVGVRPEVAQTIVSLGLDLHGMQSFSDLSSALRSTQ